MCARCWLAIGVAERFHILHTVWLFVIITIIIAVIAELTWWISNWYNCRAMRLFHKFFFLTYRVCRVLTNQLTLFIDIHTTYGGETIIFSLHSPLWDIYVYIDLGAWNVRFPRVRVRVFVHGIISVFAPCRRISHNKFRTQFFLVYA